ncbi:MAG: hypothetical protein QGH48_04810 [Candidatus Poseidoniia archaeon]|nr:hypothetical protein [Candidatus Poseidoniia archaeon]
MARSIQLISMWLHMGIIKFTFTYWIWKGKNNISQPAVTDRIVKKAWIMDDPSDADYSWGFIRQHPWGLLVVVPEDRQHQPDTIS